MLSDYTSMYMGTNIEAPVATGLRSCFTDSMLDCNCTDCGGSGDCQNCDAPGVCNNCS